MESSGELPSLYDPRDRGTQAHLSPTAALEACIAELRDCAHPRVVTERYGPYTVWLAQQKMAPPVVPTVPNSDYRKSREYLRARVTNRLLYEGECADDAKVRVQALSNLLKSVDARDTAEKPNAIDASTEEAVRAELRDPQPRLIELMVEEWGGGTSSSVQITVDGDTPARPPIEALVRALLPRFADVLRDEGWARLDECEP